MKFLSTIGLGRAAVWSVWFALSVSMGACDSASSSGASACEPGATICQCTKKSDCAATEDCVNNQCLPAGQAAQNTINTSTNSSVTATSTSSSTTGAGGGAGAETSGGAGADGENGSTGGTGGNDAEPAVVLVLDRSTSADQEFDAGASRWEAIVAALTEEDGPVQTNAASVALGVLDYTGFQGGTCPEFGDGVDPGLDNYEAVSEYVSSISLPQEDKSETPTREAIEQGVSLLSSASGPKALIVITDGLTDDTCGVFDNPGCVSQAYYAAQRAYAEGVRTYILGITDLDDAFLQGVANAGTGQAVQGPLGGACGPENEQPETSNQGGNARFWEANDTNEISSSLDEIFQAVRAD